MKWKDCHVGDFVEGGLADIQTGPFGTQLKASDYVSDGTPVINVRNIGFGDLRPEKLEYVGEQITDRLAVHLLRRDDIVFGRKGAVDRHLLVTKDHENWMQGSDCIRLRFDSEDVCSRFISYVFLRKEHQQWMLNQAGNKATMASLNQDIIKRIPLHLPPPSVQEAIVKILSAYDDLIENNTRRIKLLEDAARLLYEEWFVRLRFPGHEHVQVKDGVPEGWERKTVGEVSPLLYGKALKAETRIEGSVPVYGSSGIVGTHEAALVKGPGIIVGRKGNVGSIRLCMQDFWPIDTVYYVEPSRFSYYLLHNLQYQNFISSDVAVPGLNRSFAESLPALMPAAIVAEQFEEQSRTLYQQVATLTQLNVKVTAARDLLLPRLMSGEVAV